MKKIFNLLLMMAIATTISLTSCKTDGCTDPTATNYDENADNDDGSCIINGCTDATATNFNIKATNDDGTCAYTLIGSYNVSGSIVCGSSGSDPIPQNTSLSITNSSAGTDKIALNFAGLTLICTKAGLSFIIDNQTLNIGGFDYIYSGNGSLTGKAINLTINEFDTDLLETCVYSINGVRQ
jgi:hypothetical protein